MYVRWLCQTVMLVQWKNSVENCTFMSYESVTWKCINPQSPPVKSKVFNRLRTPAPWSCSDGTATATQRGRPPSRNPWHLYQSRTPPLPWTLNYGMPRARPCSVRHTPPASSSNPWLRLWSNPSGRKLYLRSPQGLRRGKDMPITSSHRAEIESEVGAVHKTWYIQAIVRTKAVVYFRPGFYEKQGHAGLSQPSGPSSLLSMKPLLTFYRYKPVRVWSVAAPQRD